MIASFSRRLRAPASLPVPQALPWALRLTWRWSPPLQMFVGVDEALESPPPDARPPVERRRKNLQLAPPKVVAGAELTMYLTSTRPRDRMSTAVETWEGNGRHGKGKGEENVFVDGLDASSELVDRPEDSVDDEVVDQDVGEMLLEDLPQRRRQSLLA